MSLLAKQAQLNALLDALLDLDKHEAQMAEELRETEEKAIASGFAARIQAKGRRDFPPHGLRP